MLSYEVVVLSLYWPILDHISSVVVITSHQIPRCGSTYHYNFLSDWDRSLKMGIIVWIQRTSTNSKFVVVKNSYTRLNYSTHVTQKSWCALNGITIIPIVDLIRAEETISSSKCIFESLNYFASRCTRPTIVFYLPLLVLGSFLRWYFSWDFFCL